MLDRVVDSCPQARVWGRLEQPLSEPDIHLPVLRVKLVQLVKLLRAGQAQHRQILRKQGNSESETGSLQTGRSANFSR